jgi:hypothetical protein
MINQRFKQDNLGLRVEKTKDPKQDNLALRDDKPKSLNRIT